MAEIAPFRGLRYNQSIIPDLAEVVIPPYDVISPREQAEFTERNPYNMIRLELGLPTHEDSPTDNPHTRASACMRQWEHQRILVRNPEPTIYYYELDYTCARKPAKTRKGFICVLRLEEFSGGRIRPHEKTFQAIKDERFSLMLSCHANFSPVFALYSDPGSKVDEVLTAGRRGEPVVSFTDYFGMTHRLWMVTAPVIHKQVGTMMQEKAIFIADGHHRYETALNYRNAMRERYRTGDPNAPYEFVMVYLSEMEQPGLTILPTHRLLKNLGNWSPMKFIEDSKAFFNIHRFVTVNEDELKWKSAIEAAVSRDETTIGFYCKEAGGAYTLTAKRERVSSWLVQKGMPAPLRSLDVAVLDQVVLRGLMGLSDEFLVDSDSISFMHDFSETLHAVKSGNFTAGFFINPTRIEQVREVADAGLMMPHKSTYFYPKVISGLVINPLSPCEDIA